MKFINFFKSGVKISTNVCMPPIQYAPRPVTIPLEALNAAA